MAVHTVKVEVVTPSKLFYRGEVEIVIVTTLDGDEGFMAGHCWGCKLLDIGEMWIREKGADKNDWKIAAIAGGFIDIKESIIIYTDAAEWSEDIDLERVEDEKAKAEDWLSMNEQSGDPNDVMRAKIAIAKALTRSRVAGGSTRHF